MNWPDNSDNRSEKFVFTSNLKGFGAGILLSKQDPEDKCLTSEGREISGRLH